MRKGISCLLFSFLLVCLTSCSNEPVFEIEMPHDDYFYEEGEWTVEELISCFEEMGFTNIETEAHTASDYEFDEIQNIKIDGGMFGFEQGDVFMSNDKVEIGYYDLVPNLTIDNCPDLEEILSGGTMEYAYFASHYDGQYVEFDANVVEAYSYMGGTSFIIEVCGGDYSPDSSEKQAIRIDVETMTDYDGRYINEYVDVGDNVKVIGEVVMSKSEYYEMLFIDAVYLLGR